MATKSEILTKEKRAELTNKFMELMTIGGGLRADVLGLTGAFYFALECAAKPDLLDSLIAESKKRNTKKK